MRSQPRRCRTCHTPRHILKRPAAGAPSLAVQPLCLVQPCTLQACADAVHALCYLRGGDVHSPAVHLQAAAHGCKLELPTPRPEPRRAAPAPFLDAWLNQVPLVKAGVCHLQSRAGSRVLCSTGNRCSASCNAVRTRTLQSDILNLRDSAPCCCRVRTRRRLMSTPLATSMRARDMVQAMGASTLRRQIDYNKVGHRFRRGAARAVGINASERLLTW